MKTSLPQVLLPPEKLFRAYKNSIFGYGMAGAAILTGIALAGSVIPFFMNTTNPLLMWLGNPIILGPLVLFSAILWAAIYGLDINNILTKQFWRSSKVKQPIDTLYETIIQNMVKHEINDINNRTQISKFVLLIKEIMRYKGHDNIRDIAENLREYIGSTKALEGHNPDVLNKILERLMEENDSTTSSSDNRTNDPLADDLERIQLNAKYPIRAVKAFFNTIGWINAFLVNSAGVAISALSIVAFAFDFLFKLGIIQSALIPLAVAIPVVLASFFAGATAAFMVTRIRTAKVGEDMAYRLFGWVDTRKSSWLSKAETIKLVAITISLIVGLGFAGFNYYTGYYFGSMLVELCFGNLSSLVNPTTILNATFSHTILGTSFGLLGFALTIISSSAFFYEVVHNFLKNTIGQHSTTTTWMNWLKSFGPSLRCGIIMTTPIAIMSAVIFPLSTPVLSILGIYSLIGFSLAVANPHAAKTNFQSLPRVTVIFVMSFAMAAMAAIGTAKVGSFWYNYLPAALATTSMLNIYGIIVFIGTMVAFPAVFNSAINSIMISPKPKTACEVRAQGDLKTSSRQEQRSWVDTLLYPAGPQ